MQNRGNREIDVKNNACLNNFKFQTTLVCHILKVFVIGCFYVYVL